LPLKRQHKKEKEKSEIKSKVKFQWGFKEETGV
jgi:hypothetical protein